MNPSEVKSRMSEIADRLAAGARDGDWDAWVRDVLVGLGEHMRLAATALHYEIGRSVSGIPRPAGAVLRWPLTSKPWEWKDSAVRATPVLAEQWISLGNNPNPNSMPSEVKQRALAALFLPIASASSEPLLMELARGLDALSIGEVPNILRPARNGPRPKGRGASAWQLRLGALEWIEQQEASGFKSRRDAEADVDEEFAVGAKTRQAWKRRASKHLGPTFVKERLAIARRYGELMRYAPSQFAQFVSKPEEAGEVAAKFKKVLEQEWDDDLSRIVKTLDALRRKKAQKQALHKSKSKKQALHRPEAKSRGSNTNKR